MKDTFRRDTSTAAVGTLLAGAGGVFLLTALLYNEWLLGALLPDLVQGPGTLRKIRLVEVYLALAGAALTALGVGALRIRWFDSITRRGWAANVLLGLLVMLVPLSIAELTLRPFIVFRFKTSIFMRDPDLGWRLRPNAEGDWVGAPVKVNAKGLRGPELDYDRTPGAFRILYLGDSVTFGFRLPSHEQSYPYQVEAVLEDRTAAAVETVNAGVGGYSPWQHYRYLKREGLRYQPDLIVLSFVLNDVTEKLELVRFGGSTEGSQLDATYKSPLDWLLSHSATVRFLQRVGARIRFGPDVREGAARVEVHEVTALVERPHEPSIVAAWEITLENLRRIFALSRERDVPILFVIFPFAFQFEDPEAMSGPQRIVSELADEHGVPVLDLLPALVEIMRKTGTGPEDYFLDADHVTARGGEVVGGIIAERIREAGWIASAEAGKVPP